ALKSSGRSLVSLLSAATAPVRKPRNLAIVGGLLALVGGGYWLANNWQSLVPESQPEGETAPTLADAEMPVPDFQVEPAGPATQAAVKGLLDEARTARDAGRIFSPPGTNAIELYVAAISAAPDDSVVAAELEDVVKRTLGMVESALLEYRTQDAAEALRMARLADPENARLLFLDAQLAQIQYRDAVDEARAAIRSGRFEDAGIQIGKVEAQGTGDPAEINLLKQELSTARSEQQVDEVLALANARLDDDKLIIPPNDNARYYYELALGNDPDNAAAKQGIAIIASKLVLRARAAIDRNQFTLAGSLLRDAEALDPNSEHLLASKTALDDAKANQQAQRQAAAEREAEAERLADAERRAEAERRAALQRQAELERQLAAQRELVAQQRAAAEKAAAEKEAAERLAAEQKAAAEKAAADKAAAERLAAQQRAAAEKAAADKAAADKAAAEKLAAQQRAAAEKAAAEKLAAQQRAAAEASTRRNESQTADSSGPLNSFTNQPERVAISRLTRTKYVAPKYPRSAARRNTTGWVDASFTVGRDGSVHSIEIMESTPASVFDEAATKAISQWRFEPVIENGVAVEKRAAVRMGFSLN
ncbi:MAG: TonB family protein, partial [Woeseia sp.]